MSTTGVSSILTNINNAFSGKTSGIDVQATVDALMQIQRAPERQMQSEQSAVQTRISTLGTIASQLSQLQTAMQNLTDFSGALSQRTVTSSNSSLVTATASSAALPGTHSVIVSQLASDSSSYSDPIADPSSLSGTTLTIAYGDPSNPTKTDTITLPSGVSKLQDLADGINKSADNTGVRASVITDASGQRLALVSKNSGADGNLTVTGGATFHVGAAGLNAELTVDGVPVESATNTVAGALDGVDLQLTGVDKNTPVQIGIAPDTSVAATAVNDFVTAYNNVMDSINTQFTAGSSGDAGALAGDSALRTLQSQLLGLAGYSPGGNGAYVNLQQLGVEMNNDGTLTMNSSVMQDILTNHFSDFQNFFQSSDASSFGRTVSRMLQQITDPTQGTVAADISGEKAVNNSLTQQISDFEDHMTAVQTQLMNQYAQLNVVLQRYPEQIQQISSQLSALNPSSKG